MAAETDRPLGRIVFTCGAGLANLCSISADGTGRRVLTRDGTLSRSFHWYSSPSLSQDGRRLAFAIDGRAYAADADARHRRLLSFGRGVDGVDVRLDGKRVLILD